MKNSGNEQIGTSNQMYEGLGLEAPVVDAPPVEEPKADEEPIIPASTEEPKAGDVPVQEPKAGEGVETPPTDIEPNEGGDNTPPVEQEKVFEINDINQRFEKNFKDEGEFRVFLDKVERLTELEEQVKSLDTLKEENLLLKENLDPRKYFSSDDDFKANLFKKQFPDKDAATAYKLFSTDVKAMDDTDVIAYEMMLNTPGISKSDADALIADDYGIEDGDMDSLNKIKMKRDSATARRNIDSLKSQVQIPDNVDIDSLTAAQKELQANKKEQLKQGWSTIGKEVERTLSDLNITGKDADGSDWNFAYSMSQDFPSELTEQMVGLMATSSIELNENSVGQLSEAMKKEYVYNNINEIGAAIRKDTLAKAEEHRLNKQHNPEKPKPENAPSADPSTQRTNSILSALEGTQAFKRKDFFKNK